MTATLEEYIYIYRERESVKEVKLSVEAHTVMRLRGSHIF
jgi:hypothetical protein